MYDTLRRLLATVLLGCSIVTTTSLVASASQLAQVNSQGDALPKRSPELEALIATAGACAAEFRADAYLRLAPAAAREDAEWQQELIEVAFADASEAWLRYPLGAWHGGMSTDSDDGMLWSAGETQLDALSLRCRAIEAMIDVDRHRAVEMFATIDVTDATQGVPCDRTLIPDLRAYYDTLASVADRCFTAKERAEGDDLSFLRPYLTKLSSPIDAAPAMLAAAKLTKDRTKLSHVIAALRTGLEGSNADRPAFLWAMNGCALASSYDALRSECSGDKRLERDLAWAYRKFLVKNLSAPCCLARGAVLKPALPDAVVRFNASVAEEQAIRAEEIEPVRIIEYDYEPHEWWTSRASSEALLAVQRLNSKNEQHDPYSEADRASEQYRQLYSDAVAKTEAWVSIDEEDEGRYFQMKCFQYAALLEKAPTSKLRDDALQRYLHFVSISPLSRAMPAEWFLSLRHLLDRLGERDVGERSLVLNEMLTSREPAVRLYAEFFRRNASQSKAQ